MRNSPENILRKGLHKLLKEALSRSSFNGLKILYLHGFDSSPEKDNATIFEPMTTVIAPNLDYNNSQFLNLVRLIDKEKPHGIIGHSVGGYLGYYLGRYTETPYLIFNPAFEDQDTRNQKVPNKLDNKPIDAQMAVIGINDSEVPAQIQYKYLNDGQTETFFEAIDHDVSDAIKIKYFDLFLQNIQIKTKSLH